MSFWIRFILLVFSSLSLASVGVICDPEVLYQELTENDKFIVVGSDGIYELISNDEVVGIVGMIDDDHGRIIHFFIHCS